VGVGIELLFFSFCVSVLFCFCFYFSLLGNTLFLLAVFFPSPRFFTAEIVF